MKVLRILAPGASRDLEEAVSRAIVEFNRGLDIRLRFLSIGIESSVLEVADAAGAAETVAAAVASHAPDVVCLSGDGPAALAAATAVVRAQAVLVRQDAGRRAGPEADAARAIDRLASLVLVRDQEARAALDAEGSKAPRVDVGAPGDPASGEKIVRALSRARRVAGPGAASGGHSSC